MTVPPPSRPRSALVGWIGATIAIVLGVLALACIVALLIPLFLVRRHVSLERNSATSLKTIASAQADFRSNDRDGNKVNDFWTYDVAGLYTVSNAADVASGTPVPIKLIELSVAGADSHSDPGTAPSIYTDISLYTVPSAKAGYWFHAMDRDAQVGDDYRQDTKGVGPGGKELGTKSHHTSRFGCVAYPDTLSAGKDAFIINESNTVYKQRLKSEVRPNLTNPPAAPPDVPAGGGALTEWPTDADLKKYWAKLD